MNKQGTKRFSLMRICGLFFFIIPFSCFSQENINVYDTLVKDPHFSYLIHDRKQNFFLTDKGILDRLVLLSDEVLRFHRSTEDSLHLFLKEIYGEKFSGLTFFAGEQLKWELGGDSVFSWKKNKRIETEKLRRVFTTEYEASQVFKRPEFLKDEEDAHCFFFSYYLHDSARRTIFCFNKLSGLYEGLIKYDEKKNIVYEIAFYPDRKPAMEYKGDTFFVYAEDGKKLFEHRENEISCFSGSGKVEWKYNTQSKKISAAESKQVGWNPEIDYITKLKSLWGELFRQ